VGIADFFASSSFLFVYSGLLITLTVIAVATSSRAVD
jgi:hypothetical protein